MEAERSNKLLGINIRKYIFMQIFFAFKLAFGDAKRLPGFYQMFTLVLPLDVIISNYCLWFNGLIFKDRLKLVVTPQTLVSLTITHSRASTEENFSDSVLLYCDTALN